MHNAPNLDEREAVFARLREQPDPSADEDPPEIYGVPLIDVAEVDAAQEALMPVVLYDDAPASVIVPLRHPLTVDGLHVAIISLLPPSFSDVEAVTSGVLSEIEMHSRMSAVPVGVLRALRWPDIEAVTIAARSLAPEFGALRR